MAYYQPTKLYCSLPIETIYTIHYFEYHKDYAFSGERHSFWELIYVDKGEIITSVDEEVIQLKQNQLYLYAPNQYHAVRANGAVAPNTIVISFECDNSALYCLTGQIFYINTHLRALIAGIVKEAKEVYQNDLSDPAYRKLIKKQQAFVGTPQYGAEQRIGCLLQLLLIELLRGQTYSTASPMLGKKSETYLQECFTVLAQWIEAHIDHHFTVEELCAEAMLGKADLESLFRENTGMGAIEYCRRQKIAAAKKLLREEQYNVSEISELLGFSSVHYFSRTFKKLENTTPSEYAKSVKAIVDHAEMAK